MRESRLTEETIVQLLNQKRREIRQWRFQILTVISVISYIFGFYILNALSYKETFLPSLSRLTCLLPIIIPSIAWAFLILIPNLPITFGSKSLSDSIYDEEIDKLRYLIRREAIFYKMIDLLLIMDLLVITFTGTLFTSQLYRP